MTLSASEALSRYTAQSNLSNFYTDKVGMMSILSYAGTSTVYDGATDIYTALTAAVAALPTLGGTILFPSTENGGTYLLDTDITLPANCTIKPMPGARIKISSGVTLTGTNTKIEAGLEQIFDLSLGGTIAGTWDIERSYPQWFGAVADGVTDDTSEIQAAINLVVSNGGGTVFLVSGTYYTSLQLNLTASGISIIGENQFTTIIEFNGTGNLIGRTTTDFPITSAFTRCRISNIYLKTINTNSTTLNIKGLSFCKFENLICQVGADESYGIYGDSPDGASAYYNEFYKVDAFYNGATAKASNKCIGYYLGNERSNADASKQKRSPNANRIYGGRVQGFQIAVIDVSGVGNTYISQTLEGNHDGYILGRPTTDTTDSFGNVDGYSITWTTSSNAKVLYPYLEANTGENCHFQETAQDCCVIVGYLTTGAGGTFVTIENNRNTFWVPGDSAASFGNTQFGSNMTFTGDVNFTSNNLQIKTPSTTRPTFYVDDTANGGKRWQMQNNSSSGLTKTFRIYNNTDANEMLNITNTGKVLCPAGVGVGNSAAATVLGSVVKKMQVFDASGNSLGFVPIYDAIT
jgi:hypothetical protein